MVSCQTGIAQSASRQWTGIRGGLLAGRPDNGKQAKAEPAPQQKTRHVRTEDTPQHFNARHMPPVRTVGIQKRLQSHSHKTAVTNCRLLFIIYFIPTC